MMFVLKLSKNVYFTMVWNQISATKKVWKGGVFLGLVPP